VLAWLEWVYSPCGAKSHPPATIVEAFPLLQFADAVGTQADVLQAMARACKWAVIVAARPGVHPSVELLINGGSYSFLHGDSFTHIQLLHEGAAAANTTSTMFDGGATLPHLTYSARDIHQLVGEEAAVLVEQLLHVALTANLSELTDALVDWVYCHMHKGWIGFHLMRWLLFNGLHPRIFSARVMKALGDERLQALFLKFISAQ
jgi:hypothetical protein